jgi:hypothetical protein
MPDITPFSLIPIVRLEGFPIVEIPKYLFPSFGLPNTIISGEPILATSRFSATRQCPLAEETPRDIKTVHPLRLSFGGYLKPLRFLPANLPIISQQPDAT